MFRTPICNGQRAAGSEPRAGTPPLLAARRSLSAGCSSQSGFTLASLLVILTIIAVFIAYTVPRQWSKVLQRDREKQTIWVMKQYARSIREFAAKHGGASPASLDQLKEARLPRVIRGPKGEYADPMTGKVDWILVPPTAINQAGGQLPAGIGGPTGPASTTTTGSQGPQFTLNSQASPKDYVGPFVGVRPPISGQSMLKLKDSDQYDQWVYTTFDLNVDIQNKTKVNPNNG